MSAKVPAYDESPRCAWSDMHVAECAHCRELGVHTVGIPVDHVAGDPWAIVEVIAVDEASGSSDPEAARPVPLLVLPDHSVIHVHTEVMYLLGGFDRLVERPWIAEAMGEIRGVWQGLRRAHGHVSPRALGRCLTFEDQAQCTGRVWPNRYGGDPKCSVCGRTYDSTDLIKLQISEEADTARAAKAGRAKLQSAVGAEETVPILHSGRSGVDQAVIVPAHHAGVLAGLLFTDDGRPA